MYELLLRLLPARLAGVALVVWYALLIIAVLMALDSPEGAFRYGEM